MTADITGYLKLVIGEHSQKPKFIAALSAVIQGQADARAVADQLAGSFDLDTAVGWFQDRIGDRVGVTRNVAIPTGNIWFSWGLSGLGWSQADWAPAGANPNAPQIVSLDDNHYRLLLKARVAANYWDGTIEGAYAAWQTVFGPEGFQILIQDGQPKPIPFFSWGNPAAGWSESIWYSEDFNGFVNGNMHISLALVGPPIDPVTQALFEGGDLSPVLKSAGVEIDYYYTQGVNGVPMFAWGVVAPEGATCPPTNLGGWGIGAWPYVAPGN